MRVAALVPAEPKTPLLLYHHWIDAEAAAMEMDMDKKIVGLIAAIGSVTPMAAAQAAVSPLEVSQVMNARSFSELLEPIPNALAVLEVADETPALDAVDSVVAMDDHHHHHRYRRYHHHHHHHHHHHNG
jgi:hypothetical protein